MKALGLKIAAGAFVVIGGASAWGHLQRRKRDKRAAELLREISRAIRPGGAGLAAEDAFDLNYLDDVLQRIGGKVIVMKESAAARIADQIDDAWGFWDDDEAQVYSAFRSLRDQVQVSQVVRAYRQRHGVNLIDKLRDRLDEDEVREVLSIVSKLPPYRTLNA